MSTPEESRAIEMEPLCEFDAEETDAEGAAVNSAAEKQKLFWRWTRALIWGVCSGIAIYTTKRLMVNHGFHYPLTIAFRSFVVLSIVYVIALRLGSGSIPPNYSLLNGLRKSSGDDFLLNMYWIPMTPAAIAAAASIPMFLEGLLHMPSLPTLIMIYPLLYATESLVLFMFCSASRSQRWLPLEALFAMGSAAVVLYNEYRLMVPGLIWGVLGVLFMGVARGCFILGSEKPCSDGSDQARLKAYHGFVIMTLFFGLIFSGVAAHFLEHVESIYLKSYSTMALMVVNFCSIVGASFFGTSFLAYSPISFRNPRVRFSNIPLSASEWVAPTLANYFVIIASIYSNPLPVVAQVQAAAYFSAMVLLFGAHRFHAAVVRLLEHSKRAFKSPAEKKKPSVILTVVIALLLLFAGSEAIASVSSKLVNSVGKSLPSTFDLAYSPTSRFDIVVSMYREEPEFVKKMLDSIKDTAMLRTLEPNVIVYTKDPDVVLSELKGAVGASSVERLPNLGREGGTYLQHIVDKWESLAEQTMFIQAHAHNMRELIPRINDYLVPETGMLSLGFTGVQCECGSCGDRWGWEDRYNAIPQLFEKVYKEPCKPNTPILLAYKGQFVASAKRIRGIGRNIYDGLLETINSQDGWSHNKTYVGDNEDRPDNPYFGFTMERVWSLLMQCATDGGVAATCPSLLSGMRKGGSVGDCQCLDR